MECNHNERKDEKNRAKVKERESEGERDSGVVKFLR